MKTKKKLSENYIFSVLNLSIKIVNLIIKMKTTISFAHTKI